MGKKIVCTVTNDLNFDQRMIRICNSLAQAGYEVTLVGRKKRNSKPLQTKAFKQKRLYCYFEKGKLLYIEYNIRLLWFLLFMPTDVYCAIDLDTILPNLFASKIKRKPRVYDAHELFCEMEEIVSRPMIYRIWKKIEAYTVPQFPIGYTIGECYAEEFKLMYGVNYEVVRNATVLQPMHPHSATERFILYQGAVNEGRSFETLIPAMQKVNGRLIICGEGNFFEQAKQLVTQHQLEDKIMFTGYLEPQALKKYTEQAYIGITLFTNQGKSNYYSMANRYFDYMHHGVPQISMAYPEYVNANAKYEVAYLLEKPGIDEIANALNTLLQDETLYLRLKQNCFLAREVFCWQEEEKKLISVYKKIFGN